MCTITLTLAKQGEEIPGPYSSLTCFAGVRPGAVPERGEIEGHRVTDERVGLFTPDKDGDTHTSCGRVAVLAARRGTVCGEVGRVPGFPQLTRSAPSSYKGSAWVQWSTFRVDSPTHRCRHRWHPTRHRSNRTLRTLGTNTHTRRRDPCARI